MRVADAFNHFNYFTDIEEYFWRKRGAHILVSPLDWAIVETWQQAGIPLGAVLRGIDRAFESYARSRRGASGRTMKTLAYCVDAVLDAAEEAREAAAGGAPPEGVRAGAAPLSRDDIRAYFLRNIEKLRKAAAPQGPLAVVAAQLTSAKSKLEEMLPLLDSPAAPDLEDMERRLTVLDQKLAAALLVAAEDDVQLEIRREMDRALAPYRRRMTADQLSIVERQYVQKRLLERYDIPRLSLFYLS